MSQSPAVPQPRMKAKLASSFLVLFFTCMFALHLFLLWDFRDLLREGYPDFTIFYSAATIIRQGHRAQLYDEKTQFQTQQESGTDVRSRKGPLPYNHPPFEALIFVPLAWLPYFKAYLAWNLINLAILCAIPLLLRAHIPILNRHSALFWILAELAFAPIFFTLMQGQDSILLLLIFALVFVALKRNAGFGAGALLALGLFRFHLVLPLALVFFLRRKGNALWGFSSVALVLLLISASLVGWNTLLHYPSYVWHLEAAQGRGAIFPANMPTLHGFLDNLIGRHLGKVARDVVTALASVGLCILAAVRWPHAGEPAKLDLAFSLVVVVTVMVSYHAYVHDLSLLLFAVLLVANYLWTAVSSRYWQVCLLLGPMIILYLGPFYMVLLFRYGQLNWLALVLLIWAWALWREIPKQTSTGNAVTASL
jgi:hypothetical protein